MYSLGLTLYELLTLRPAFVGKDRNELLAQVMHGEPPRPRSINRDVPRDLETVVLKAIARDPAHRYPSARRSWPPTCGGSWTTGRCGRGGWG